MTFQSPSSIYLHSQPLSFPAITFYPISLFVDLFSYCPDVISIIIITLVAVHFTKFNFLFFHSQYHHSQLLALYIIFQQQKMPGNISSSSPSFLFLIKIIIIVTTIKSVYEYLQSNYILQTTFFTPLFLSNRNINKEIDPFPYWTLLACWPSPLNPRFWTHTSANSFVCVCVCACTLEIIHLRSCFIKMSSQTVCILEVYVFWIGNNKVQPKRRGKKKKWNRKQRKLI